MKARKAQKGKAWGLRGGPAVPGEGGGCASGPGAASADALCSITHWFSASPIFLPTAQPCETAH